MYRLLALLPLTLALSACGDGFRNAQQQWLSYRNSPAYYEGYVPTTTVTSCSSRCKGERCYANCLSF